MRLLMVCLGNICRSPLAEGAVRARLEAARLDWVVVDSAGTGGWHVGDPPDHRSVAVARRHGVDIAAQRARQLRSDDYHAFDWLLCADRSVLRDVQARAPTHAPARAALLLDWAGTAPGADVPDPYTGGPGDFLAVWRMVDEAAEAIVARIAAAKGRG